MRTLLELGKWVLLFSLAIFFLPAPFLLYKEMNTPGYTKELFLVKKPVRVTFNLSTGPDGGVYQQIGQLMAEMITVAGTKTTVTSSPGSADNIVDVSKKKTDGAIAMLDAVVDAYTGSGTFKDSYENTRVAFQIYPNYTHLVVPESSSIKSIQDLKGKRIGIGAKGSGIALLAEKILDAHKIDVEKDIIPKYLTPKESTFQMGKNEIDAFFLVGGIPTPELRSFAEKFPVRLIDLPGTASMLNSKYGPIYKEGKIPLNSYNGMQSDTVSVNVPNVFIVHKDMDNETVYRIVKAEFDNKTYLAVKHIAMLNLALENQTAIPVPYHPGALRYFKEKQVDGLSK